MMVGVALQPPPSEFRSNRADVSGGLGLAVLMAGQIRTLQESAVRNELYRTAVEQTNGTVFAHMSAEDTIAEWKLPPSRFETSSSFEEEFITVFLWFDVPCHAPAPGKLGGTGY